MYTWETLRLYLVTKWTECNPTDNVRTTRGFPLGIATSYFRTAAQDGLRVIMQSIKHPEIRQDCHQTIVAIRPQENFETTHPRRHLPVKNRITNRV
jgi:hypothetical protein